MGYLSLILSFLLAFIVTYVSIPVIIRIAKAKKLLDEPNLRTSHAMPVPTLGGIGIVFGVALSIFLFVDFAAYPQMKYIMASVAIIAALGIKDDIIMISVFFKAAGLFLASAIVVVLADIRISSFYGVLGIYELPYTVSVLFSVFVIATIVNGYNFIDGINGLAASISLISSIAFGSWFVFSETPVSTQMAILVSAVIGALIPFLKYNVNPAKIFMGDTGSLIIGFLISIFALNFINESATSSNNSPLIAIGVVFIPIVDLLKVIGLRLMLGKSPFHPDRNHLHHLLLRIGLSHSKSTIILSICSVITVFLVLLAQSWETIYVLILLFTMAAVVSVLPYFIIMKKESKRFSLIVN